MEKESGKSEKTIVLELLRSNPKNKELKHMKEIH